LIEKIGGWPFASRYCFHDEVSQEILCIPHSGFRTECKVESLYNTTIGFEKLALSVFGLIENHQHQIQ
jgi:hypothetical protein